MNFYIKIMHVFKKIYRIRQHRVFILMLLFSPCIFYLNRNSSLNLVNSIKTSDVVHEYT